MDNRSNYLKIDEAARFLGVSTRWVYRRIWSGELPASKIGGLYFIDRDRLKALLAAPQTGPAANPPLASQVSPPLLKCSVCLHLLGSDEQIGAVCQAQGCEKLICADCLANGVHYCPEHSPTREQRLAQAEESRRRGELAVLVRAVDARLLELNFLNRLQSRITGFANLIHPQTGELLHIEDWPAALERGDERGEVMRLMGKVVLDSKALAQQPLNAYLHYRLPPQKKQRGGPVDIRIQTLSRLPAMLADGFDSQPLQADELAFWLDGLTEADQASPAFKLLALAAVSGWSAAARRRVQGETTGEAFMHPQALVYLFDLQTGELIYNRADERARRYAELFIPLLPSEELAEAARAIEAELLTYQSLTLDYAGQVLPFARDLLQRACEELAASGRYSLVEVPEYGLAIVRKA